MKYKIVKYTQCDGTVYYRIKRRFLFVFWRIQKDESKRIDIDMQGGTWAPVFQFDNLEDTKVQVLKLALEDKRVKGLKICNKEDIILT
jgi:hypothetical protein